MSIIQIGICDDDNTFIKHLEQQIKEQLVQDNCLYNVDIRSFNDGAVLLKEANEFPFDLLFLDIEMPHKGGFSIAESISLLWPDTYVIFVSSHENYVFTSYEYAPLWFVRKASLNEDLSLALKKYNRETKTKHFAYKIDTGIVNHNILQKDIIYFESIGHDIIVKTRDNKHRIYGSLKGIEEEMKNPNFVRIHRSFLLNIKFILHVTGKKVELIDGEVLDLGRAYKKHVKEKLGL